MILTAIPDDDGDDDGRLRALPGCDPATVRRPRGPRRQAPRLRLVPPPVPEPPPEPRQPPPPALRRMLRLVLEALNGHRPAAQLAPVLPADAIDDLVGRQRTANGRHELRRVLHCYPSPTAVEASVVIDYLARPGLRRTFAAATRFDLEDVRWVCTVFRLL